MQDELRRVSKLPDQARERTPWLSGHRREGSSGSLVVMTTKNTLFAAPGTGMALLRELDCISRCACVARLTLILRNKSAHSSVGRAGDCRWLQLISLGHWFESGCADNF